MSKLHLEQEGFKEILTAENGEKGIEILCEGDNMDTVSLILCDIRMPIINGMVAADNFKEMAPNIPVVIVTGYADSKMAAFLCQTRLTTRSVMKFLCSST